MKRKKNVRPETLDGKIMHVAALATGRGEGYLAAALISVATVHLVGDKATMGGLAHFCHRVAESARVKSSDDGHGSPPPEPDPLAATFEEATNAAEAAGMYKIAAIMTALTSLYYADKPELISKLAEAASSLASEGVGRRPKKAVLLIDNDLGWAGSDPPGNDGMMETF